uniref:Uncharacterized protein n=1 Tax=Abalone asfa-like virus TaxID=2839893 RepID=A0A5K7XX10_9VIRU|nr:hypothetical protein [Abalone asfa-like virus]
MDLEIFEKKACEDLECWPPIGLWVPKDMSADILYDALYDVDGPRTPQKSYIFTLLSADYPIKDILKKFIDI